MQAVDIPGWMTREELEWLSEKAKEVEIIVEIGSYQGRSTRALGENVKGCVYAIDDWKGPRTVDEVWWQNATPPDVKSTLYERFINHTHDLISIGKIVPIRANHDDVPDLPMADMVFIDGDHSYAGVKRDIKTWIPRLKSGGLLCGHDIYQAPIQSALNEEIPGWKHCVDTIWEYRKP